LAFLFDTDAISEVLRPRPSKRYARWLATVDRELQLTSAIVIGELYKGAFRSASAAKHLKNVEELVLPRLTILSYDVIVARRYGQIRAELERRGECLADADLQIGATALEHNLEVVTGNLKHFQRIPGLRVNTILADSRKEE
jgi:tRNA(fMet)-specific endonuclease VapC